MITTHKDPSMSNHGRKESIADDICISCGARETSLYLRAPDRYHGRKQLYDLVCCSSCSLVWLYSPPTPEVMGEHYGADYDRSVAAAGRSRNRWKEHWGTLAKYKTSGNILDLGCSSGGFLAGLASSSWKKYGIEMSQAVADEAKELCGGDIYVGDILDAPFQPESFDAITCFHVFEHLYKPKEVLSRVSQWLKPGGIFYTMMPNIHSAGSRVFKSYWYALELPRHLFHFSPDSLRTLAKPLGLTEVSITTQREPFVESSVRYLVTDLLQKIGVQVRPLAKRNDPALGVKIVRKAFRLTMLPVLNGAVSLAGDGESIHAILKKSDVQNG